jgi:hypothetical protein
MSGMEIMLKSMGFDPSSIKAKVEEMQGQANIVIKAFADKLDAIAKKQDEQTAEIAELKTLLIKLGE